MTDEGMIDEGVTEPKPRRMRVAVLIGALALGLLGGGGVIVYSTYTELDLTLQEFQATYIAEQTAAKRLARKAEEKAEELSRGVQQTQARVKALEEGQKASADEQGKLEARNTKLETAFQGLQAVYAAEQATAKRLAQKADELSKALEEAQARVRVLEASHKASEQHKSALEARSSKLETTVQGLQTAYAAEQEAAKKLAQKAEELSKALEQVHARMKGQEEKPADLAVLNHTLGTSYSKVGMNAEARNAFHMALESDPNHAESHFELARLYLGHFDDKRSAVPHLRRYLQLRPAAKDSERAKGWLLKAEKELDADKERKDYGKMDLKRGFKRILE